MGQSKAEKNKRQQPKPKSAVVTSVGADVAQQVISNPDFLKRIQRELPAVVTQVTKMHSGPLPDPETLAEYNRIHPEAAERIISMAEKEQNHRHRCDEEHQKLQSSAVSKNFWLKLVGQFFGLSSVVFVIYLAIKIVDAGHPGIAATVATGVLAALASVFVFGQKYKNKNSAKEDTTED